MYHIFFFLCFQSGFQFIVESNFAFALVFQYPSWLLTVHVVSSLSFTIANVQYNCQCSVCLTFFLVPFHGPQGVELFVGSSTAAFRNSTVWSTTNQSADYSACALDRNCSYDLCHTSGLSPRVSCTILFSLGNGLQNLRCEKTHPTD